MLVAASRPVSVADVLAATFAVVAMLGAAFSVFRANAAQTLIALLRENVTQLETSRDEQQRRATAAEAETKLCTERARQQEERIKMLERLVTAADAIAKLTDHVDTLHVETMAAIKAQSRAS